MAEYQDAFEPMNSLLRQNLLQRVDDCWIYYRCLIALATALREMRTKIPPVSELDKYTRPGALAAVLKVEFIDAAARMPVAGGVDQTEMMYFRDHGYKSVEWVRPSKPSSHSGSTSSTNTSSKGFGDEEGATAGTKKKTRGQRRKLAEERKRLVSAGTIGSSVDPDSHSPASTPNDSPESKKPKHGGVSGGVKGKGRADGSGTKDSVTLCVDHLCYLLDVRNSSGTGRVAMCGRPLHGKTCSAGFHPNTLAFVREADALSTLNRLHGTTLRQALACHGKAGSAGRYMVL